MSSVIQHKRSTTAGHTPTLSAGELAINEADTRLYYRKSGVVTAKRLVEPHQLITKGIVTSVASLTLGIDPAVIGVFRSFELLIKEMRPVTDNAIFWLRVGDSGSIYSGASDYASSYFVSASGDGTTTQTDSNNTAQSAIDPSSGADNAASSTHFGTIRMGTNDPNYDFRWKAMCHIGYVESSGAQSELRWMVGERVTVIDPTRIQLLFSTGNIAYINYALYGDQI